MLYLLLFVLVISLYFAFYALINGRRGFKARKNMSGRKGKLYFLVSLVHFIVGIIILAAYLAIAILIVYAWVNIRKEISEDMPYYDFASLLSDMEKMFEMPRDFKSWQTQPYD
jgi:hypothetical protein